MYLLYLEKKQQQSPPPQQKQNKQQQQNTKKQQKPKTSKPTLTLQKGVIVSNHIRPLKIHLFIQAAKYTAMTSLKTLYLKMLPCTHSEIHDSK